MDAPVVTREPLVDDAQTCDLGLIFDIAERGHAPHLPRFRNSSALSRWLDASSRSARVVRVDGAVIGWLSVGPLNERAGYRSCGELVVFSRDHFEATMNRIAWEQAGPVADELGFVDLVQLAPAGAVLPATATVVGEFLGLRVLQTTVERSR